MPSFLNEGLRRCSLSQIARVCVNMSTFLPKEFA